MGNMILIVRGVERENFFFGCSFVRVSLASPGSLLLCRFFFGSTTLRRDKLRYYRRQVLQLFEKCMKSREALLWSLETVMGETMIGTYFQELFPTAVTGSADGIK